MQLYTKCHHCQREIRLPFAHPDKSEIIKEKGDSLRLTCHHCQQVGEYEWPNIKAREEHQMLYIILIVLLIPSMIFGILLRDGIFLTFIWYNLLAGIFLVVVPFLLYLELRAQDRLDTHVFNHQ